MMQMKIKLDEERLAETYYVDKVWAMIDEIFAKISAVKEVQPDGAVTYTNHPQHQNTLNDFGMMYLRLKKNTIMQQYCTEWMWYDNDDDETKDLTSYGDDMILHIRKENPSFGRSA